MIVGTKIGLSQHRQQTAIAEIERLGGVVSLRNGGPDWLRRIVGNKSMRFFDGVYLVNLRDTQATDSDLENLHAMTEIERLNLAVPCAAVWGRKNQASWAERHVSLQQRRTVLCVITGNHPVVSLPGNIENINRVVSSLHDRQKEQ